MKKMVISFLATILVLSAVMLAPSAAYDTGKSLDEYLKIVNEALESGEEFEGIIANIKSDVSMNDAKNETVQLLRAIFENESDEMIAKKVKAVGWSDAGIHMITVAADIEQVAYIMQALNTETYVSFELNLISYPCHETGDVDGNGIVEARDYLKLKRYVLGTYSADEEEISKMDINDDGKVDAKDYIILKRAVLGSYSLDDGED